MWTRKTELEIKQQRRGVRWAIVGPLFWGTIISIVFTLRLMFPPSYYSPEHVLPFAKAFFFGIASGIVVAAVLYLWQVYWGHKIFSGQSLICNQCYRFKKADGIQSCDCGGTFEESENWKYTEG